MNLRRPVSLALAALVFVSASVSATPPSGPDDCLPEADDAWLRVTPAPMWAGYLTLYNRCDAAVVVTGARSDAFGDISVHETRLVDGVSRMRAVPRLVVAPGGDAVFRPGGLHLMISDFRTRPDVGDRVRIELLLEDGRRVPVTFETRWAAP